MRELSSEKIAARFWARVVQQGDCWVWMGEVDKRGYGRFSIRRKRVLAHRWTYESIRAEISQGLQLDHLCRNPSCVNPWHLDPVTALVNLMRSGSPCRHNAEKEHCPKGHPYSGGNLRVRIRKTGRPERYCATCARESCARWRSTRRSA